MKGKLRSPTPNTAMKVIRIETTLRLREPSADPIRDALQALPGSGTVEVLLHTDDGLTGRGDAGFGRIAGGPRAVQVIVEEILAPLVVGRDPAYVRQIHEELLRETEYGGSQGLAMFGLAAVDTALWDLLGKAAGWPVHRLLGAARNRGPGGGPGGGEIGRASCRERV